MRKQEIREMMIKLIAASLEERIKDVEELIDEDDVYSFMWAKDYGESLIEEYIEVNKVELVADFLDEIYDDITLDEIRTPF